MGNHAYSGMRVMKELWVQLEKLLWEFYLMDEASSNVQHSTRECLIGDWKKSDFHSKRLQWCNPKKKKRILLDIL